MASHLFEPLFTCFNHNGISPFRQNLRFKTNFSAPFFTCFTCCNCIAVVVVVVDVVVVVVVVVVALFRVKLQKLHGEIGILKRVGY